MKKVFFAILFFVSSTAFAETNFADIKNDTKSDTKNIDENWNIHLQSTLIYQGYPAFHADYSQSTSLSPRIQKKYTDSVTAFFGVKLWEGGEFYYNPEFMKGIPLSHAFGVADFTNGDAQKAGSYKGKLYNARLFLRQTFNLGGETERVASDQNTLARTRDISRVTVTVGKFAVNDIFDNNTYSHNPRTQFLNWGLMDSAAWDYPEDAFSYDEGFAVDFNQKQWAVRFGSFIELYKANGKRFSKHGTNSLGNVLEFERRYSLFERSGITRLLTFFNRARMGNFQEAINANESSGEDITTALEDSRKYGRKKYGFAINSEQKLTDDLGAFSRISWNDGKNEDWCFTQVNQSFALGLSLQGNSWNRADDTFGIAEVISGISRRQQEFLKRGGNGFIVGDGNLNYSREQVIETYYSYKPSKYFSISPDYQYVRHPAFNRDRGPVHVFSGRFHVEI